MLIRRSPLIILLALEIMLNAGNLALIAFARQHGDGDGQIFALTVMVVAAAEAVLGLGLIVAVSRKHVELDVDTPHVAEGLRMEVLAWTALFAPAVAVVVLALVGDRITSFGAGLIASAATGSSRSSARLAIFVELLGREPEERSEVSTAWTWLTAGDLRFGAEILIDPLSVFMMLIVSGVGFLILAYAIGYMHGDEEERRYHAYKALFIFSMLLLVQAGNLLLLLAGWGMVGLSSYLLINYWHRRREAVAAGKKAFIMNAVGDATFVLALFILIQQIGSLDFATVFAAAPEALGENTTLSVLVALGLLGGAVAKSAQIPLHTWLPDAMEGPTPVSALIHAATMVTAGVYLIARTSPLFELAIDVHDLAGDPRRRHAPRRRAHRARPDGHQARDRVLDDEPDRLHVRRRRPRRVRRRDVPPDDARLLQGAPLHGGRRRHPRAQPASRTSAGWAASRASCRGRTAPSSSARSRWRRSRRSRASSPRTRSSRAPRTPARSAGSSGASG